MHYAEKTIYNEAEVLLKEYVCSTLTNLRSLQLEPQVRWFEKKKGV
jgi:hypothetical protein